MKFPLTFGLVLAVSSFARASESKFPAGYWETSYRTGNISAVVISVSLLVPDLLKAEAAVNKDLSKAGGILQGLNNNYGYIGDFSRNSNRNVKSIAYSLDSTKAAAAAKGLIALGELQQYTTNQQITDTQLEEVKTKLKQVQDEIASHPNELKSMPIAAAYLDQLQTRLASSKDAYETGLKRATINVSLAEEKPHP